MVSGGAQTETVPKISNFDSEKRPWRTGRVRKTSCPAPPYYSLSLYILGIYALRVTPKLPPGSRFTWFAASAERKLIFKVEKSMNPEVLGCFSQFSNFSDFSWFWDALAINFDCLARFPAQGSFQIDRTSNFKLIQIFTSYGVHVSLSRSCFSRSNILNWTPAVNRQPGFRREDS